MLTPAEAEELTREHWDLPALVVRSMPQIPPRLAADARGEAWLGFVRALRDFEPERTTGSFRSYASIRCRGAVLDWLRTLDPLSRAARAAARAAGRSGPSERQFEDDELNGDGFPDERESVDARFQEACDELAALLARARPAVRTTVRAILEEPNVAKRAAAAGLTPAGDAWRRREAMDALKRLAGGTR